MAKSYFGKFDGINSVIQAQMALDQGKLLKPFVAIYSVDNNEGVHYDDLEEINAGSINPEDFGGEVAWNGATQQFEVTAGNLYWHVWIDTPYDEWISCDNDSTNQGDGSFSLEVMQNDGALNRQGQVKVEFTYEEDDYDHKRNTVFINVEQAAATVSDGYVTDQYSNVITALTASSHSGSVEYLYGMTDGEKALFWSASSESDWVSFGNTSCDWTNSSPTEVMVDSNTGDTRNANIVFNFYLDDSMESLVNTVVIPLTQNEAAQVEPGSVSSTALTIDGSAETFYVDVTAENLWWKVVSNDEAPWYYFPYSDHMQNSMQQYPIMCGQNMWTARTGSVDFEFYTDENYSDLKNTVTVELSQGGYEGINVSFEADRHEEFKYAEYPAGTFDGYIINNPSYEWKIWDNDQSAYVASGDTADTFSNVPYRQNSTPRNVTQWFPVQFFDNGNLIASCNLQVILDANPYAPSLSWDNDGYMPDSGTTGEVYINYPEDSGSTPWTYWSLTGVGPAEYLWYDTVSGNTITGDSSVNTVNYVFGANTADTEDTITMNITFYDGNGDAVYTDTISRPQMFDGELDTLVNVELTVDTTEDDETVNFQSLYNNSKFIYDENGNDVKADFDNGSYTFGQAGTYVLSFYFEPSADQFPTSALAGNSTVTKIEIKPYNAASTAMTFSIPAMGMQFVTNLAEVTIGDFVQSIGANAFSFCRNLATINCYATTEPTIQGRLGSNMYATGELHVPSGADYSNFIAALPSGWTVVDDL